MAQLWYSPVSINAAQVPTTQTDFPVMVSVTDARFKDVAHSGHVNRSDGFDIRPYTDTTLGTAIAGYELERYIPSTGELIMWVKVASLSSSTTPIVLGYGDTSITTDGSSTTCWSSSFLDVYHLRDGTTLNLNSATGSHNGTNHSATATTGKIDGAASFVSASSQSVTCGTNTYTPSNVTISAWINATSFPNAYNCAIGMQEAANGAFSVVLIKSTGKLGLFCRDSTPTTISYDGTGTNTLSAGTWYYVVLTYAGGIIGYVNGSVDHSLVAGAANLVTISPQTGTLGNDIVTASRFWNGLVDEARFASVARSADWITTEYNNQNAPGTFESLGSEVQISPISGLYTK